MRKFKVPDHPCDNDDHFLITEVTRMKSAVCVAAVNVDSEQTVRLLRWNHSNWPASQGLEPGMIVCQSIRDKQEGKGYPHETEDTQLVNNPSLVHRMSEADLFKVVKSSVDVSVQAIFDGRLIDSKYIVDQTKCRSLGAIMLSATNIKFIDSNGKLRLMFSDGSKTHYDCPVTDMALLQLFEKPGGFAELKKQLKRADQAGSRVILRLGLARGWDGDGKFDHKRCYLQVNGVIYEG